MRILCHTVARRYEFDSWLAKQYFMNKHSKWVKYCFGCKFWRKINEIMLIRNSCVRLWKLNHSDRRCSFYSFHECYPITDYREPFFLLFKVIIIIENMLTYAKRFLAMLKSTCANSISKSILSNFYKTYFFERKHGVRTGSTGRKSTVTYR